MHAGFYLNHVMQDPYPARLKAVTLEAVKRGMTHNYFVNGQDFKHFLLNLEVCGRVAWNPEAFDPKAFYRDWTGRYFGEAAAESTIKSLKLLNQSHDIVTGFTFVMRETEVVLDDLEAKKYREVDISPIKKALSLARESLVLAQNAAGKTPAESELVFDDQIGFPARIFAENLELNLAAANWLNACYYGKTTAAHAADTLARLNILRQSLIAGSKWEKWQGWTHPENFRIFTPPPTVERVNRIAELLNADNGKG
ncbi:hypothetical protein KAH55_10135 [bacterium]|nr:hypothetical protein [bacterium]